MKQVLIHDTRPLAKEGAGISQWFAAHHFLRKFFPQCKGAGQMALSVPPKANCVRNVLHDLPGNCAETLAVFVGL